MGSTEENCGNSNSPADSTSSAVENSTAIGDMEIDLLKEHYFSLREETHLRIELQNKRITQGLTVIGAITGYGLLSENHAVIALTPFVLGILYIESARMYSQIGRLAGHMYHLEEELQDVTPLFQWETKHGGLFGVSEGIADISWYRIPTYGLVVAAVGAYIGSVWVSVRFWPPGFGTWPLSADGLKLVMAGYGIFIIVIWISAHRSITNEPALPK